MVFVFQKPGFVVVGFRYENETLYGYENLNIPLAFPACMSLTASPV